LFVKTTEEESLFASASSCISSTFNPRPMAGRIEIYDVFDFKKNNIKAFLQTVLFHEMTHILVFTPRLIRIFGGIREIDLNGEKRQAISSPKVLEKARLHFGCPTLQGVPLEDQGGDGSAGSHWDGRYMLGDYMVSTSYNENTISDITLALFEDSGWYKVNYYTGGLFKFGKGAGCEFFEKDCIINEKTQFPNEFCHKVFEPKCLNSHLGYGECFIGSYKDSDEEIPIRNQYFKKKHLGGLYITNYCPVSEPYYNNESREKFYYENNCRYGDTQGLFQHFGEVIGPQSMCFESSLLPRYSPQRHKWRSICYKMECDTENKNIIVYVDDLNITCPFSGGVLEKIKGFKGKINCPSYYTMCTSDIWCNDMFECIDKKSVTDISIYDKK